MPCAALHVHCIIRVEGRPSVSASAIAREARTTTARVFGRTVKWGRKADCRGVSSGRAAKASQVAYLVKSLSYGSMPPNSGFATVREQHIAKLSWAAKSMRCGKKCRGKGCKGLAHRRFGANKGVVSVSLNWSWTGLNRTRQRAARKAWAQDHGLTNNGTAA